MAKLNAANQRWVPILDPPIHVSPGYPAYDSGVAADVFLKDITGRPFVGQVRLIRLLAIFAGQDRGIALSRQSSCYYALCAGMKASPSVNAGTDMHLLHACRCGRA